MLRAGILCSVVALLSVGESRAIELVEHQLGLPGLRYASIAWAPLGTFPTASGKSVLAMSGENAAGEIKTYVFRIGPDESGNPSIARTNDTDIPGVVFGDLDWADYDGDGDLDLAIAGRTGNVDDLDPLAGSIIAVYTQRDGLAFSKETNFPDQIGDNYSPDFAPVDSASLQWVDYDVDGYVDLFVTGRTRSVRMVGGGPREVWGDDRAYMLRHVVSESGIHGFEVDDGVVSHVDEISPIHGGDIDWGDTDGDGDPDLAVTGQALTLLQGGRATRDTLTDIYISDPPGVLARNYRAALPARHGGGIAWGDYDGDARPELAFCGSSMAYDGGYVKLGVYDYGGYGALDQEQIQLDQVHAVAGPMQWGDTDNDGRFDLVAMGTTSFGPGGIRYYRNLGDGPFERATATGLPASLVEGDFSLGHLDDDGTLDLIAAGYDASTGRTRAFAWTTHGVKKNDPPGPHPSHETDARL